MSQWFDIQLHDNQNVNSKRNEYKRDLLVDYDSDQSHCENSLSSQTSPPKRWSSSSLTVSPEDIGNLSPFSNNLERESDSLKERSQTCLLVDDLLNNIYFKLRPTRSRLGSVSSDTSSYSKPILRKPLFREAFLRSKGNMRK